STTSSARRALAAGAIATSRASTSGVGSGGGGGDAFVCTAATSMDGAAASAGGTDGASSPARPTSVDIGTGPAVGAGSAGAGSGAALATTAATRSALPRVTVRSSGGTPRAPTSRPAAPVAMAMLAQAVRGRAGAPPGNGNVTTSRYAWRIDGS